MVLKQNFEWFVNTDPFRISGINGVGWASETGLGSFAVVFVVDLGLVFLTRTRRFIHRLYGNGFICIVSTERVNMHRL